MNRNIVGRNSMPLGISPSVILTDPKYAHNVGQTVRAAACFGIEQVWYTGNRFSLDGSKRLPREERMKGYDKVKLIQFDYPFEQFKNAVPVAIELSPSSEILTLFEHPENAVYVFGPEDDSIPQMVRRHCHRFVTIPTKHCTNLSAAVYIVLYDRLLKRQQQGLEDIIPARDVLDENRGFGYYDYREEHSE